MPCKRLNRPKGHDPRAVGFALRQRLLGILHDPIPSERDISTCHGTRKNQHLRISIPDEVRPDGRDAMHEIGCSSLCSAFRAGCRNARVDHHSAHRIA
jgi:hypothetical protein